MKMSIRRVREYLLDMDKCEWWYLPITFLLGSCLTIFLVCTYQIGWVFTAERHLTLSEPFLFCVQAVPAKCTTRYMAILADGQRKLFDPHTFEFEPGAPRQDLTIRKSRYSFTYYMDGQKGTWPYLFGLVLAWIVSLAGMILWFLIDGPTHLGRFMRRGRE